MLASARSVGKMLLVWTMLLRSTRSVSVNPLYCILLFTQLIQDH
jgi:hypothetical protein